MLIYPYIFKWRFNFPKFKVVERLSKIYKYDPQSNIVVHWVLIKISTVCRWWLVFKPFLNPRFSRIAGIMSSVSKHFEQYVYELSPHGLFHYLSFHLSWPRTIFLWVFFEKVVHYAKLLFPNKFSIIVPLYFLVHRPNVPTYFD